MKNENLSEVVGINLLALSISGAFSDLGIG